MSTMTNVNNGDGAHEPIDSEISPVKKPTPPSGEAATGTSGGGEGSGVKETLGVGLEVYYSGEGGGAVPTKERTRST